MKTIEKKLYDFLILNRSSIGQQGKLIEQIISGDINGFVLEDFLTSDEVDSIYKSFNALDSTEKTTIHETFNTYPIAFSQFDQMTKSQVISEAQYFDITNDFINNFKIKFGVDLERKIIDLFSDVSNIQYKNAYYKKEENKIVPFNFRELKYPGGDLISHCEQYFIDEFPEFYKKLEHLSDHDRQLSFFVVISSPEKGGELTLFDALWPTYKTRIGEQTIVHEESGQQFDLDNGDIGCMQIKPKAGSIVVFAGGNIWHRVEKTALPPARLTIGGFVSFSLDKKIMYPWS